MQIRKVILADVPNPDGRFIAYVALFGMFVGISKALLNRSERTSWKDIVAGGMVSAVSAMICGSALRYLYPSGHDDLNFALSGVAAWLGVIFMDLVGRWAQAYITRQSGNSNNGDKTP